MKSKRDRIKAASCEILRIFFIAGSLLYCIAVLPPCLAQQPRRQSVTTPPSVIRTAGGVDDPLVKRAGLPEPPPVLVPDTSVSRIKPPELAPEEDPVYMSLNLNWTDYKIHKSDDYSPVEIILSGNITASAGLVWWLSPANPQMGNGLTLNLDQDIFGRSGPMYASSMPLNWSISMDGGPFVPMTVMPNNSGLSTILPMGYHTFQVRITAMPNIHQDDGYYNLHLSQTFTPQF